MSKKSECVKVVVRCRPLNDKEIKNNNREVVIIDTSRGEITLKNPKSESETPKIFPFDKVYDSSSKQEDIYSETAYPLVESVLEGYNSTIFAYGQTGTGKTFTMEGTPENKGIMNRAFDHIFNHIQGTPDTQFLVYASYLEIYMEEIRDLLSNSDSKLVIRENQDRTVYVQGLSKVVVKNVEEINDALKRGSLRRHIGGHDENSQSSRSHAIFSVTVEASYNEKGNNHIRVGKLNLVDLAGSERQSKTNATGLRAGEGILINKSLVVLGNVISRLSNGDSFIPYRDSELTRLLQNSLGGNSKTLMFANIGPSEHNYSETSGTLGYASRAKHIKQKPIINQDPNTAMLKDLQDEISNLKAMLDQYQKEGGHVQTEVKIVQVEDEEKMKAIQQKYELEKQKIEDEKNSILQIKEKLQQELEREKNEAEQKTENEKLKLLKKLKKYEDKILQGKEAMRTAIDKERENQKIIQELEDQRLQQLQLERELQKKEEENVLIEKKYNSQKEEIDDLKRKLYKIHSKYQQSQTELRQKEDELFQERVFHEQQDREWDRVNKLKDLIINSFIPDAEILRIENFAIWDEYRREWTIPKGNLAGNQVRRPGSAFGLLRPQSSASRSAISQGDQNPRHRPHNVLPLEIEVTKSNLDVFDGTVSEKVQNTLNSVLNPEEDMTFSAPENQPNVYMKYQEDSGEKNQGSKGRSTPGTAQRNVVETKKNFEGAQSREGNRSMLGDDQAKSRKRTQVIEGEIASANQSYLVEERTVREKPHDKVYPRARGLLGRIDSK